ncbi:hypothetical protein AZI86_08180 [Bdellovibrio bacteriovorus]|uniref:Uncharacterized protein n=1 Tax=Bdellovibrio bacteriovorus TaxID=959 RepID=A0A150WRD1_BDEBC|nr:hypothetical protein [Bdellovibrio bacteriovorus]KYG66990.1 hypothetical protein AZI86_08180 [Bdellovibrio bacteriovorus]
MKPLKFVLAALLSSSFAWAEPIAYKDWMVQEGTDEIFAKDSCQAATNVAAGTNRTQLLLSFTKDRATVPQLLLKVWDQATPESQLLIKVSSKVSYPLFLWKASTQPDQPSIYWYAPIGWSPLADYIAAANTLTVQGASTHVIISLKGSSVSLQRTATCLKASEILPLDFLKKLNAKTEGAAANYASVDEMILGNEKTFEAYRTGLLKTKELTDLRKGSAKILAQETEALNTFNTAQKRWDSGDAALKTQLATQAQLQQTLAQTTGELQSQQTALPATQENAKNKQAIYEPLRKQFASYVADVDTKQSALNKNIRDTRNYQSRISDLESEIPRLRNEQSNLASRISSLSYDVDRARSNYQSKQSEADRYNVRWEYDRELRSDFTYSNRLRDAERYRDEGNRYANEARNSRTAQQAAQARLNHCQNQNPPQNCDSIQNEIRQHENQASQAEQRSRSAINNANNAQREAESRARSIMSEIERKKRSLESDADDAERRYRSLQSDLDSLQNRHNQISNILPDLRNELSYSRDQVPKLQAQRPSLEAALADSIQKRDTARIQLDFDRIEGEYKAAAAQLSDLEKAIAKSKSTIVSTESSLKKIKPVIEELTKDLAAKTLKRDQAAQKLASIQEALKPFRAQEAALVQTINELVVTFDDGKARYQRTYETWIAPVQAATWMNTIGSF